MAALDWAYFVTFGSELAVVSMLPLFFMETFELSAVAAGFMASGFAFMNLVARPAGGYLSDTFGRKRTLSILIVGLAVGYLVLARHWLHGCWSPSANSESAIKVQQTYRNIRELRR